MWYQVSLSWTADPVQDKDSASARMLRLMTPWHAAVITQPTEQADQWGTTVSMEESGLRSAVATAMVVVRSSARDVGMTGVTLVEVYAKPQPTPPGVGDNLRPGLAP